MTKAEIRAAADAYLATLQDEHNEEYWCTERVNAKDYIEGFLKSINVKKQEKEEKKK